jgi:hypothetical protein
MQHHGNIKYCHKYLTDLELSILTVHSYNTDVDPVVEKIVYPTHI